MSGLSDEDYDNAVRLHDAAHECTGLICFARDEWVAHLQDVVAAALNAKADEIEAAFPKCYQIADNAALTLALALIRT